MTQLYMVFDVESKGLHGEGFSVGYVVVNDEGTELASGYLASRIGSARGWGNADQRAQADEWLSRHVAEGEPHVTNPYYVRKRFKEVWHQWRLAGAILVADCAWPVEARFLIEMVDDDPTWNEYAGPFPLHEVATARLLAGLDPVSTVPRLPRELPEHYPTADARQSARLWLEAIEEIKKNARSTTDQDVSSS